MGGFDGVVGLLALLGLGALRWICSDLLDLL